MEEEKKDIQFDNNQAFGDQVINLTPSPVVEAPTPVAPVMEAQPVEAPTPVAPVMEAQPMAAPVVEPAPMAAPTVEPTPVVDPTPVMEAQPMVAAAPVAEPAPVSAPVESVAPVMEAQPAVEAAPAPEMQMATPTMEASGAPVMEEPVKKKKPIVPIICVVLLLLVAGGFGLYKFVLNNPYESAITTMFKSLHDKNKLYDDTYKVVLNIKLEALNDDNKEMDNYKLSYDMTSDAKNNKFLMNIDASGAEDIKLKANAYYADSKLYFKLDGLDKTYYMDLKEFTDSESSLKIDEDDVEFLINKFESGFKTAFKDEKRQSETKTVTVKGKEEKLSNKYYIVDVKNAARIVRNFASEFNNDETIKRIAKMSGMKESEVKEMIEEYAKMEDLTYETDGYFKVGVYTRGLFDEYAGINISIKEDEFLSYVEDGDYFILTITRDTFKLTLEGDNDKGTLEAKAVSGEETFFTFSYNSKSKSNNLELVFPEQLKVTGDFYIEEKAKLEEFNTKDAINVEEMTEEESKELTDKYYGMLGIDTDLYTSSDSASFEDNARTALGLARTQFVSDAMKENGDKLYGSECENQLDGVDIFADYLIKVDKSGKVVKFYYGDYFENKQVKYEGTDLQSNEISDYTEDYDDDLDYTCE